MGVTNVVFVLCRTQSKLAQHVVCQSNFCNQNVWSSFLKSAHHLAAELKKPMKLIFFYPYAICKTRAFFLIRFLENPEKPTKVLSRMHPITDQNTQNISNSVDRILFYINLQRFSFSVSTDYFIKITSHATNMTSKSLSDAYFVLMYTNFYIKNQAKKITIHLNEKCVEINVYYGKQ